MISRKEISLASFCGNKMPLVDKDLRAALTEYLRQRIEKSSSLKTTDPLFVTQKGGPYSPNTLQEHMALMLRDWAGIEKASSHSGRRSVITNVIHKQKKSVKVAQKIMENPVHRVSSFLFTRDIMSQTIEPAIQTLFIKKEIKLPCTTLQVHQINEKIEDCVRRCFFSNQRCILGVK